MAWFLLSFIRPMKQSTIKNEISFEGISLHSGDHVSVTVRPADANTGIVFLRTDVDGAKAIRAEGCNVVDTSYATTIGYDGVTVSTIEHLMAAFYGLRVDNAIVYIDGPEVPIMDGSSAHFVELIDSVGLTYLDAPKKYMVIKRPIKVSDGDKYVLLMPTTDMNFTIDYSIEFAHPFLNKQSFSKDFTPDMFAEEIGAARTFGFLSDVETLRANGLAKGGSLSNAVVIGEDNILNEEGLRYPDEFVRHKVLDIMGDISLLGHPIIGRLVAHRSGHALNHRLVKKVLQSIRRWETVESLVREEFLSPDQVFIEKFATA